MRASGIVGLLCLALCVVGVSQVQFVEQWRTSMPPVVVDEPRPDLLEEDITLISIRIGPSERLNGAFDRKTGDCLWALKVQGQSNTRDSSGSKVVGSLIKNGHMWVVLNNGYYSLSSGYPVVICDAVTGEELKSLPEFSAGYRVEYSADLMASEDTVAILEMGNSQRFPYFNRSGVRATLQLYDADSLELIGSIPVNSSVPEELRERISKFSPEVFTMGGYAMSFKDNTLFALEFYHPYLSSLTDVPGYRGQPHYVFDLGENHFLTWWRYYNPEVRYGGLDPNGQTLSIYRWVPGEPQQQVWLADGKFGIRDLAGVWTDGRFWSPAEGNKIVFFNRRGGRVFTLQNYWAGADYYGEFRPIYIHPATKELLVYQTGGDRNTRYHLLSMQGRTRPVVFPSHLVLPEAHADGILLRMSIGEGSEELVFGHLR